METLEPDASKRVAGRRRRYEASGGVLGAIAGASVGAIMAGPAGLAAGALVGAAMGASTAWAMEMRPKDAEQRDRKLDRDIGVTEGEIGVPGLEHPPATIGAFSREASGAGGAGGLSDAPEAEGPIQPPPD